MSMAEVMHAGLNPDIVPQPDATGAFDPFADDRGGDATAWSVQLGGNSASFCSGDPAGAPTIELTPEFPPLSQATFAYGHIPPGRLPVVRRLKSWVTNGLPEPISLAAQTLTLRRALVGAAAFDPEQVGPVLARSTDLMHSVVGAPRREVGQAHGDFDVLLRDFSSEERRIALAALRGLADGVPAIVPDTELFTHRGPEEPDSYFSQEARLMLKGYTKTTAVRERPGVAATARRWVAAIASAATIALSTPAPADDGTLPVA